MIRNMEEHDRDEVLAMMRTFYTSPAVLSDGSEEIYRRDFECCVEEGPYLEGYVFQEGQNIQGYAMVAKSFSTEFGRLCIWIEDIYIKEEHRGSGIGGEFLKFIEAKYPDRLLRLEAETENEGAVRVYQRHGFEVLPYLEMKKCGGE